MSKNRRIVQENFKAVLTMVGEGITIDRALRSLKITRGNFYNHITKEQKDWLDFQRLLYSKTRDTIYRNKSDFFNHIQ
tara:strand:- start:903 stop:1136 length:234 start_codon:yes stop_codon:yes gene_type:complete